MCPRNSGSNEKVMAICVSLVFLAAAKIALAAGARSDDCDSGTRFSGRAHHQGGVGRAAQGRANIAS
eukprot:2075606-Prymnesium_polylepis.1